MLPSEMTYNVIGVCKMCEYEDYLNANGLCLECEEMDREQQDEADMLNDEMCEPFDIYDEPEYPDDAEDSHLESEYEDRYSAAEYEADMLAERWDLDTGGF